MSMMSGPNEPPEPQEPDRTTRYPDNPPPRPRPEPSFQRAFVVVAALVASLLFGVTPAKADTAQEITAGCEQTWHAMSFAGYYHTVNGTQYGVYKTPQMYVAGSWSNCEDTQVQPNVGAGYFMLSAYARNKYFPSGGGSYYNAWRWCGGGCVTGTDVLNGTRYEVHISFLAVGTDLLKAID